MKTARALPTVSNTDVSLNDTVMKIPKFLSTMITVILLFDGFIYNYNAFWIFKCPKFMLIKVRKLKD